MARRKKLSCPQKRRFYSWKQADKFADRVVMPKYGSNTAAYRCPQCHYFHLRTERW